LVAHTVISRFVDHLPYYRQAAINARSGVHTPRSSLAARAGAAGAALEPLYGAHKRFVLGCADRSQELAVRRRRARVLVD
jgi:transposase